MSNKRFHDWIGLSGVDSDENKQALIWAKRMELPVLIIALCILVTWYWESRLDTIASHSEILNIVIWLFFCSETLLLTWLCKDRFNYLKNNWLNIVIIIAGIPIIWETIPYTTSLRALRLLIFLNLLLQLSTTIRSVLAENNLGQTLMVSLVVIVFAGYLIAGIDPNIKTPSDGIWWAWVTVTTVGYGDLVPVSPEGRMFGGLLILMGIGLFSMLTAAFSVFFISKNQDQQHWEQERNEGIKELNKRLTTIETQLKRLNEVKPPPEVKSPQQQKEN